MNEPKLKATFPNGRVDAPRLQARFVPPRTPQPPRKPCDCGVKRVIPNNPTVGLVVSSYSNPAYVALHLENRKRFYPTVPALVIDDCSTEGEQLRKLCERYGAEFVATPKRYGHLHGDLNAFVRGLWWADFRKCDLVVKMSRTWLVCKEWVEDFKRLAFETQYPTYSNRCDTYNFGFRTECMGMHVASWLPFAGQIAERVELRNVPHVEGYLDSVSQGIPLCEAALAYTPEHPGYATWDLLGTDRHKRPQQIYWHDSTGYGEYYLLSREYKLSYTAADFQRRL